MTCQKNNIASLDVMELILENGMSGMGKAIEVLLNQAMEIERTKYLQAEPYERTEARNGYANGHKSRGLATRMGKLELRIPQVREGNFYPTVLEKGKRSERALCVAAAEMYVSGVSTRKVEKVMEALCGFNISSTEVSRAAQMLDKELEIWRNRPLGKIEYLYLDACYEKVRVSGQVIDCAVLTAIGVGEDGKRDVLGASTLLSEAEVHWRSFLQGLQQRGMHGVKMIISDAHEGLKAARKAVFPSVPWQRCQFHLQQNAQNYVTKRSKKEEVGSAIRAVFNAPNIDEAGRLLKMAISEYEKEMPQLSRWMEENIHEGLTVFSFPERYWKKIRTSNVVERLNREIRRRTKVVGVFPNVASCERLISAILVEVSDDWQTDKAYLDVKQKE
jgi:transposase-like protein